MISLVAMYFVQKSVARSDRQSNGLIGAFNIKGLGKSGAQERTRTFTAVKPLAPEASASTNSATWARAG